MIAELAESKTSTPRNLPPRWWHRPGHLPLAVSQIMLSPAGTRRGKVSNDEYGTVSEHSPSAGADRENEAALVVQGTVKK
ncbi:MAG: hypothetical protein Q9181_005033 [Wetmoreana brouardii]